MSLRRVTGNNSIAQLSSASTDAGKIELPSNVNIIWSAQARTQESRAVVLPFTGDIIVGRDVASGRNRMLSAGQLSVFAASDESLAGRALAEETTLVMGDQVRLQDSHSSNGILASPKGFIRFETAFTDLPVTMDIVAFAPAEGVSIQRFGGGEYRFTPGWWAKIKHKSTLVITVVLITGFLSVLNSLVGVLAAIPTFRGWWE
jgi:hypothetical protein